MRTRIVLLLVLSAFLLSCQSALFTDWITGTGQPLYQDDFSDSASGWMQAVEAGGSMGYVDGTYHIAVQQAAYSLWALSGQAYRDVRVEADAAQIAGPPAGFFGLVCRSQGRDRFYFFVISGDGYYGIGKSAQGSWALLGQEMMLYSPVIPQGARSVRLRFDCIGPALTAYVNGEFVASVQDAEFPRGDAGLIAGTLEEPGLEVAFDNFVVIKP